MQPEDVKRLRDALACSVGELAATVGVDVKTVLAWESGDLFPTKRHVDRLKALERRGPSGVHKAAAKKAPTDLDLLGDPRFWRIVRKLIVFPELFAKVEKLSEAYDETVSKV